MKTVQLDLEAKGIIKREITKPLTWHKIQFGESMAEISWQDFEKVDIRVGTVVTAQNFPEARNPAYILTVDFGDEIGLRKSSAQITDLYSRQELEGKQVLGVVNFPPKQVGPIMSECLVLGFYREDNSVVLAMPDLDIKNGARLL